MSFQDLVKRADTLHEVRKPDDVKLKRSVSQILRGETIPVQRFTAQSAIRLPKIRQTMESRLSRARSNIFRHSTVSRKYYQTAVLDQEMWVIRDKDFHDDADISLHPSYNIKNFSYGLNCFVQYMEAKEKYEKQFLRELEHIIANKRSVCEQYFTRSYLCYSTLWPPLHSKRELDNFIRKFFQLTPKQKDRLNYLMKTDLSFGR